MTGRPVVGAARPWVFPTTFIHELANGLTVIVVPVAGRPIVEAALVLDAGSVVEPVEQAGLAGITATAFNEGTDQRSGPDLALALEREGMRVNVTAGWDAAIAAASAPVTRLDRALALLAEMALTPSFPAGEVDRIRTQAAEHLVRQRAYPAWSTTTATVHALFEPSTRWAHKAVGTPATVSSLSRDHVVAFHRSRLAPSAATVVIAGAVDVDGAVTVVEHAFGAWAGTAGGVTGGPAARPRSDRPAVVLADHPEAVQTELAVVLPGPRRHPEDRAALAIAVHCIGGGFTARLNTILREELGVTYGARAGLDLRRGGGWLAMGGAIETAATASAARVILGELDRIATDGFTAEEVGEAVDQVVLRAPLAMERPAAVVSAVVDAVVHDKAPDDLGRYLDEARAVTPASAQAAFQRHFGAVAPTVVASGAAAAIGDELAGLGPVEEWTAP